MTRGKVAWNRFGGTAMLCRTFFYTQPSSCVCVYIVLRLSKISIHERDESEITPMSWNVGALCASAFFRFACRPRRPSA